MISIREKQKKNQSRISRPMINQIRLFQSQSLLLLIQMKILHIRLILKKPLKALLYHLPLTTFQFRIRTSKKIR